MRHLVLVSVILFFSTAALGQKTIEGSDFDEDRKPWAGLLLDIGLNQYKDAPQVLDLNAWKSRGVSIYYYYGICLSNKFTLAPGIGLGLDSYVFKNESVRLSTLRDSLAIQVPTNGATIINSHKSKLAVNYIDLPLEIRFETGKSSEKMFRIALGGKAGVLFNAHTKVKFTNSTTGDKSKEKSHGDFGLNSFRYGLTGRIGYGYFNLFGYYSLSDLFDTDLGPKATPFMLGLSFSPSFHFRKRK